MYARMIMIIPGCITAVQADILRCEPEQKEKRKIQPFQDSRTE
jgi:hypothetical protein